MILRKPYALFIKYFKLLHAVMAVFAAFILYRTVTLYNFFRSYSNDYTVAMNNFSLGKYLNTYSFLLIFVVLILTIILLSVMIYKKKPKSLYIYNIVLCVLTIALYGFCNSTLRDVTVSLIDIRTSKALRDLSLIGIILQSIGFLWISIRATGFDIRQFDFGTDLQQLDISEKDSEEIEVSLDYDRSVTRRNINSKIRNARYVYVEHKFLINTALVIFLVTLSFIIYFNISIYSASYRQGHTFSASRVTLNVKDSYILDSDPNGNKLVNDSGTDSRVIVAVRFQIRGYGKNTLNTGITTLRIGEYSFGQKAGYAKKLYDLGTAYINQEVSSEFETYILAFEVPESLISRGMKLKFNDNVSYVRGELGAKNIYVKLKPVDLREAGESFSKKLTETIDFSESILGSSDLTINSYEINNKFRVDYKYCYKTDKCIDSYEFLTPTATGNYFKTLMKVSGKLNLDGNNNIEDVYDLRTFLNNFGSIYYKVGDKFVSKKINSQIIKPKSGKISDTYIEIPYEAKDASEMYLQFNIRNQKYKYTLK